MLFVYGHSAHDDIQLEKCSGSWMHCLLFWDLAHIQIKHLDWEGQQSQNKVPIVWHYSVSRPSDSVKCQVHFSLFKAIKAGAHCVVLISLAHAQCKVASRDCITHGKEWEAFKGNHLNKRAGIVLNSAKNFYSITQVFAVCQDLAGYLEAPADVGVVAFWYCQLAYGNMRSGDKTIYI